MAFPMHIPQQSPGWGLHQLDAQAAAAARRPVTMIDPGGQCFRAPSMQASQTVRRTHSSIETQMSFPLASLLHPNLPVTSAMRFLGNLVITEAAKEAGVVHVPANQPPGPAPIPYARCMPGDQPKRGEPWVTQVSDSLHTPRRNKTTHRAQGHTHFSHRFGWENRGIRTISVERGPRCAFPSRTDCGGVAQVAYLTFFCGTLT